MPNFITSVSWETIISNVQLTWNVIVDPPTHIYTCEVFPINPNDKGSGDLVIGYYLVDYLGNVYEIEGINGWEITVRDINKGVQTTDEYTAPYQDQTGFIYTPKSEDAINLSQSDLIRLYPTARDLINQIDNNSISSMVDAIDWSTVYNPNVYNNLEYSLEDWHAHTQSAGRIWGGSVIDNLDGTVEVTAGGGLIKLGTGDPTDCPCGPAGLLAASVSQNVYIEWVGVPVLTLTDEAYNYIYIRGSDKTVQVTLDFYSIDFFNDFTIGRSYRSGTNVLVRLCGTNIWNFNRRVQLFGEEVFPVKRARGLIVGSSGTRNITMTQGILWAELVNRFLVNWGDPVRDFDSSVTDTFTYWYRVGATWVSVPASTQISNTQWNDTTTGLVNFSGGPNRWGVHWVYVDHDAGVHVVYGTAEYGSLVASEAATPPSLAPGIVAAYGTLCARINIQKDTTLLLIYSAFDLAFSASGILDHGDLSGLGDDDHAQYYNETRGDARYSLLAHNHTGVYEPVLGNPLVDGYVLSSTTSGVRSWFNIESNYFKQSGNAFGATAVLGTTDNYDLQFKTNDIQYAVLKNTGELGIGRETIAQQRLTVNYGNLRFNSIPQPANHTATLAGLGAGNLSNGLYHYQIIPVSIYGDCGYDQRSSSSVTVVDNTTDGQVQLTNIPVFAEKYQIIARKIYRGKVGESATSARYLGIINDNITTTYIDNVADGDLPDGRVFGKPDESTGLIYKDGSLVFLTDTFNTIIGQDAGALQTSIDGCVLIGSRAGYNLSTGLNNTIIGYYAGHELTTGPSNVAIGAQSLRGVSTGSYNIAIGGGMNTLTASGSNNIALGRESAGRVTGSLNVFLGRYAGRYQGGGSYNIGIGSNCMHGISTTTPTGGNNIAMGYLAMGSGALAAAQYNIALGSTSLRFITTGNFNTAIGGSAGTAVTTGGNNIFLGYGAGNTITTGSQNIYIGRGIVASAVDVNTEFRLGYGSDIILEGHMGTGPFLNVPVEFRTAGDVVFNGIGTATESNILYYNTTTKKVTYGTAPAGPSFGLEHQIPYTNSTVDDFNYSTALSFSTNTLTVDNIIRSPDSTGVGIPGKDLIIKAGTAWSGDITSATGILYLSPGNSYNGTSSSDIYFGDSTYGASVLRIRTAGSQSNVALYINSKGSMPLVLNANVSGSVYSYNSLFVFGSSIGFFNSSNVSISGPPATNTKPFAIGLIGGSVSSDPAGGDYDGGDVHIYGREGVGTGLRGDVYFGDGSAGYLKAKTTETNVVHYNETTGLLSYGVGGTDFTYTNATAMPTAVGGFAAGTTFTAATLDELWTGLLYPYQSPAFSAFTMSAQTTPLEVGIAVTGGNRTFTWSTTNSSNINVNSIVIRDMNTSTDLATGLANDGTELVNIGTDITKTTTNDTHIWRISGVNTNSVTFTRNYTITWYSPFYYGVGAPALSVAQIQGLTKVIVAKANYTRSFSPSSQVYYYAYPASYGLLTSIKDPSNFETIADWTVHAVDFTNNPPDYNGGTVSYYVYEFNNLTTQSAFNITFTF